MEKEEEVEAFQLSECSQNPLKLDSFIIHCVHFGVILHALIMYVCM